MEESASTTGPKSTNRLTCRGGSVISCIGRNISPEAPQSILEPGVRTPTLSPVMASDSSVRECRVAWIRKNRIGLTSSTRRKTLRTMTVR